MLKNLITKMAKVGDSTFFSLAIVITMICFVVLIVCVSDDGVDLFDFVSASSLTSNISRPRPSEGLFSVGNEVFDNYMKEVDLKTIPGYHVEDDFDNWDSPLEVQRDFPMYMPGFAKNDEPVWVYEWGRWKFDKYANGGKEMKDLFNKQNRYTSYLELKSQAIKNTKENPIKQHVVIYDLEGLRLNFLTDRKILQLQMKLISDYRRYFEKYVSKTIVINVNPVSEVLINLMRPFFLRILHRIEVYGTNKLVWEPQLLKTIPKDQLPEWYGGNKDFKPLYVVG